MKVVFAYDGLEHLGIGYLASVARAHGHHVQLVRVPVGDYIRGYRTPFPGITDTAVRRIGALRPDIVAFSLVSPTAGVMMSVARRLRGLGVKTLCGGPHATAEPELTSASFDGVIRGEAESVFADALEVLESESPFPPWMAGPGRPALSPLPDLNHLPFPAKDLFYANSPECAADYLIVTSRGCPFSCTFCAGAWEPGKPRHRQRDPLNVVEELVVARSRYGPKTVYFVDDIFTLSTDWLREFLPLYRQHVGLPFHCVTHPSCLDDEIAGMLGTAGCFALRIGVQTLTPRARAALGRRETTDQVAQAIDAAKRVGMRVEVDHMVGVPEETPREAADAATFYLAHRPDAVKVYWLTPLPGSAWLEAAVRSGELNADRAAALRRGEGFPPHSYLFSPDQNGSRWLGIHFLLAFLPILPSWWTRLLLRTRLYIVARIPSFALLVGGSRLWPVLRGWDEVGKGHAVRFFRRFLLCRYRQPHFQRASNAAQH